MARKVFALSLDSTMPMEAEFLQLAQQVPRARRQEWVRLILRAGFKFYKENLGKPGFEGFHGAQDNGRRDSTGAVMPVALGDVDKASSTVATEESKAPTAVETPPMGADVLRGMFKLSSCAEVNGVGQEKHP